MRGEIGLAHAFLRLRGGQAADAKTHGEAEPDQRATPTLSSSPEGNRMKEKFALFTPSPPQPSP
jgi:hypothetical protein